MAHEDIAHEIQDRVTDSYQIDPEFWSRTRNAFAFVALVSWLAVIAGYFTEPARFFQSYLFAFLSVMFIPLGAMFFNMTGYLTGAAWSVPMRRIAENIMMVIPAGFLLFIPVLAGIPYLYEWSHTEVVAKDALLLAKSSWLNPTAFAVRAFIYFSIWSILAWRIFANSTKQDKTRSLDQMHAMSKWSAPGLLLTFLTVTLAAFDWSMSLDPHWYSTIFGIYCFAGGGLTFMCVWTLICLWFRDNKILANTIRIEHYHDLGKWMFALTIFWAYIAFSQYLLIWYANLPEETIWFRNRFEGTWGWVSAAILFGHFAVPFFVLIPRASKRNPVILRFMASWLLSFQLLDWYWQVMPNFSRGGVAPHWLDFACLAAVGSVAGLAFWSRLRSHALLPVGDPRFEQGLNFQNI
ncbi:MAG: hypothetical protein H7039_01500 [Bryobacteraceae bacterium]|nr:hypothetical protein [Bryobacteraceae bacterium]